jgi:hypothetical protein
MIRYFNDPFAWGNYCNLRGHGHEIRRDEGELVRNIME